MNPDKHNDNANPASADKAHTVIVGQVLSTFTENFGMSRTVAAATVLFIVSVIFAAVFWSIHSAPPHVIWLTSGPPGSSYERIAEKYRGILASNGVVLKILPSADGRGSGRGGAQGSGGNSLNVRSRSGAIGCWRTEFHSPDHHSSDFQVHGKVVFGEHGDEALDFYLEICFRNEFIARSKLERREIYPIEF